MAIWSGFMTLWAVYVVDIEYEGGEGQCGERQPQMSRLEVSRRLSCAVRKQRLHAHKQQTAREGQTRTHIMKNFSMVHLQKTAQSQHQLQFQSHFTLRKKAQNLALGRYLFVKGTVTLDHKPKINNK